MVLASRGLIGYIGEMTDHPRSRAELLAVLRAHEAELRERGVETITLFGSAARGDATGMSDVDLAVRPGAGFSSGDLIISAGWRLCANGSPCSSAVMSIWWRNLRCVRVSGR